MGGVVKEKDTHRFLGSLFEKPPRSRVSLLPSSPTPCLAHCVHLQRSLLSSLLYHQTILSLITPTHAIRQHFITSSSSYDCTNHILSSYRHLNPLWLITSIDQQLISLSSTSAYILMIKIKVKIRVEVTMTMMMSSLARLGESVGVSIRHALSRARDMALACWLLQTTRSPTLLSRFSCYSVQMKITL